MPAMTVAEIEGFMKKFFPQARMPIQIETLAMVSCAVTYSIPPNAKRSAEPFE